jgi:tetratricopeptide (TPR) repeat protein
MTDEYRQLGYDTSNDMIRHDSCRGLGEYARAALHIRNAGAGRLRMGQMMFDEGNFAWAAANWLSAAACFDLATDPKQMREALDRAKRLFEDGKIPPERRDLHESLKEREEEFKALERKLNQFGQDAGRVTGQEALDWLLGQIRNLPGSPRLHVAIALRAGQCGQLPLAFAHLEWAETFAPEDPEIGALRVRLTIASGDLRRGIEMGRTLLGANPQLDHLRILLAQASTSRPDTQRSDWEEAIEMLRPLTDITSADVHGRLLALALVTILQHGLGHEAEYHLFLSSFDQLTLTIQSSVLSEVVSKLRRAFPQVFPKPGSDEAPSTFGPNHRAELDSSALRTFWSLLPPVAGAAA